MAGGQSFYDDNTNAYSTTKVGSVFSNMDGLSRDDRIRYDTPSFYNFSAATSYIADGGGDITLRYNTKIEGIKLAAAVAYANPGSTSSKTDFFSFGKTAFSFDYGFFDDINAILSGFRVKF